MSSPVKVLSLTVKTLLLSFFQRSICRRSLKKIRLIVPIGVIIRKNTRISNTFDITVPRSSDRPNHTYEIGFSTDGIMIAINTADNASRMNTLLSKRRKQRRNTSVSTRPTSLFFIAVIGPIESRFNEMLPFIIPLYDPIGN